MTFVCGACGRICETRYAWAHHGCEARGVQRELNRSARRPAPLLGTAPNGDVPTMPGTPAAFGR